MRRDDFLYIFPNNLKQCLKNSIIDSLIPIEIRIRINRSPVIVFSDGSESVISDINVSREMIDGILTLATRYSLYAYQDTIRQGFITLRGGHRLGVLGQAVINGGKLCGQKNISFLNMRIAHECIGCSSNIMEFVGGRENVLVISPPGCGKTTLLRDMVRNYSYGNGCEPRNVVIIDERGEIAACVDGIPQNDVGPRTDVADLGNKSESVFAALRSMSPNVIVMDEIGGERDILAVRAAAYAGVQIVASIHAYSLRECRQRDDVRCLFAEKAFMKIITLSDKSGVGTVEEMIDLSDC